MCAQECLSNSNTGVFPAEINLFNSGSNHPVRLHCCVCVCSCWCYIVRTRIHIFNSKVRTFYRVPFQWAVWVDLDLRVKLDLCWGLGLGIKMVMAGVRGWSGLANIGIQTFFCVFVCVWDKDHLCGAGTEWIWSVPCHLALDLSLWPSTLADHTRYSPSLSAFPFSSFFLDTVYPRVHLQASTVHTETHVRAHAHTHSCTSAFVRHNALPSPLL